MNFLKRLFRRSSNRNFPLYGVKKFKGFSDKCIEAKLLELYDGDTGWFIIRTKDLIPDDHIAINVRMLGFNAPELKPRGLSSEEKEIEKKAGELVKMKVEEKFKSSSKISIKFKELGIYGRFLGEIYIDDEPLFDWMMKEGFGKPYDGKGKAPKFSMEEKLMLLHKYRSD